MLRIARGSPGASVLDRVSGALQLAGLGIARRAQLPRYPSGRHRDTSCRMAAAVASEVTPQLLSGNYVLIYRTVAGGGQAGASNLRPFEWLGRVLASRPVDVAAFWRKIGCVRC